MIKVGDLLYAKSARAVGVVVGIVKNRTWGGLNDYIVFWADNGKTVQVGEAGIAHLKKDLDKYR